jgi:hypothetical protein
VGAGVEDDLVILLEQTVDIDRDAEEISTAALLQPPSRKGVAGPRYDHATLAGLETVREIPPYGWHMVQLLPAASTKS